MLLTRHMAVGTKRQNVSRPKGRQRPPRRHPARVSAKAKPAARPVPAPQEEFPKEEELARDEELSKDEEEEPKEEELAKEEAALKAAEAEEQLGSEAEEEGAPLRSRERSGYDGDTAIKLYLREIGQVKLLTPQEEIELAARIKRGDKRAREQMIKANLRLVVKIARDYEGIGLPLLDLISEGNIGLMKAVERFDPAKGGKLSTYGSWWIKQSIKRALANQSKTIRLPVHLVDKISKMRRTAMRLQEELGREPTDEELGEELGISASRVAQMRMAAIRPASLDAPIGNEDSNNFAEVVQDESADTPYEQARGKDRHPHVAGDGQDPRPSRGHHPARPIRPGRRAPKDPRRGRPEIRRHPRARAPDPEYRLEKTQEDD